MIVIAGTVRVKAEALAGAVEAAVRMCELSRAEPGCRDYRFALDIADPTLVHLFEEWEDQAALDTHFTLPHFAEFSKVIGAAMDGRGSFNRYVVESAGPLFG